MWQQQQQARDAEEEEEAGEEVEQSWVCRIPKDKATPIIFQWLENLMEHRDGATVPKRKVHARYVAFCKANSIQPTTSSAFGKLLLSVFPRVSSRRIGKRGDAENHYTNLTWRAAAATTPKTTSPGVVARSRGTYKRKRSGEATQSKTASGELARRSNHQRPLHLWNADAHLEVARQALMFVSTYREEYWVATPLNPAALESSNVLHLMCTSDGDQEHSALSFNVLFASSMGALLQGRMGVARDLFEKARDHLGDIFDVPDYSVAQALERIPALARFFCSSPEEGHRLSTYYITLSMQMCRSLGAMNSFVYLQCLLTSMWYSAVDRQQFETLRQYPYYSGLDGAPRHLAEKFHLPFEAQKKLVVCFHCVGEVMKAIFQYRSVCNPDRYQFDQANRLIRVEEPFKEPQRDHPLAIHNLLTADQEPRQEVFAVAEPAPAEQASSPHIASSSRSQSPNVLMPTYAFSSSPLRTTDDFEPLFRVLSNASAALDELHRDGVASSNLLLLGLLHFESLRAELLWCQGRQKEALEGAWATVRLLEDTPVFGQFTSLPVIEIVLNLLTQMHAWDGVERVLARLSPLFSPSTSWRDLRDKYLTRMRDLRAPPGQPDQRVRREDDLEEAAGRGGGGPLAMRLEHILCPADSKLHAACGPPQV